MLEAVDFDEVIAELAKKNQAEVRNELVLFHKG